MGDHAILITGTSGQVGGALLSLLGDRALRADRQQCDLSRPETLRAYLEAVRPAAIINPAAYTKVDQAEGEEDLAHRINAESPGVMARYAADAGIPFIHYSTDYVFPGTGEQFHTEEDATGPLSAYGRTKLAGEQAVREAGGKHLIFRTSWVFDGTGKNFLTTMMRLGRERETLRVVADQWGAPTYAPHIARATLEALQAATDADAFPSGMYHLCAQGVTSWYGFASEIFRLARARGLPLMVKEVDPITSDQYPTPAARPGNSRLSTTKLQQTLGVTLPSWEAGTAEAVDMLTIL
jgi:dTDP-4-dehydrorhamnose reductase